MYSTISLVTTTYGMHSVNNAHTKKIKIMISKIFLNSVMSLGKEKKRKVIEMTKPTAFTQLF